MLVCCDQILLRRLPRSGQRSKYGQQWETVHLSFVAGENLPKNARLELQRQILPMALPAPIGSAARIRSSSLGTLRATLSQMLEYLGITTPSFWPYICQYYYRVLAVELDSVKIPYEKPFER